MRRAKLILGILLPALFILSLPALSFAQSGKEAVKALANAFHAAIEKVQPAVVSISAEKKPEKVKMPDMSEMPEIFKNLIPPELFKEQFTPKRGWQGSGVIISSEGEILTNNHVVKGADKLTVTLDDGKEMEAKVVAADTATDVALIQLKGNGPFPFAVLGDSDALNVGDWVLAIGNPFGLNQSVSEGIVSAKGRTNSDVPVGARENFYIKDFIQTTAAINPGNSGGPLINIEGEVIGVNNAIQTIAGIPANLGIGFAIPSTLAKSVLENLKKYGKVKRGYIGVELNFEVPDYYKQKYGINYGALVTVVRKNTPGEKAGIQHGDLIIQFNGVKVKDNSHLINMVTRTPIGNEVEVIVFRQGKEIPLKMTLVERPQEEVLAQAPETSLLGMEVQTLTPEVAKGKGFEEDLKGVIVTEVEAGGAAQEKEIQVGDVITEINNQAVETLEQFNRVLSDIKEEMVKENVAERAVLLYVHRAKSRIPARYLGPVIRLENKNEDKEKKESKK